VSQHPATNTPIAPPGIQAGDPAPAPDFAALRAAIEAAGWDERDRLTIRDRAIWLDCTCCGNANGVTHPVAIWADEVANLIVQATNSLPALLDRIAELEREAEFMLGQASNNARRWARSEVDIAELLHRIAELEAAQAHPDAYIAVKRNHAACAEGPEWHGDAAVIPAGDHHEWERADHAKRGYELLPIAGTETGTRFAAPQGEPIAYMIAHTAHDGSTTFVRTPYGRRPNAEAHAARLGSAYRVVELHEVTER
jgi:hypothetical protein